MKPKHKGPQLRQVTKHTSMELKSALPDFFSAEEAAKILGYNVAYLRRLAHSRKVPFTKRGGRVFFSHEDLARIYTPIRAMSPVPADPLDGLK